jgi:hypothetical protein
VSHDVLVLSCYYSFVSSFLAFGAFFTLGATASVASTSTTSFFGAAFLEPDAH